MARWEYQSSAAIPKSGGELQLYRREMARAPEYAIRIKGEPGDLMSSRAHASEDALGTLPLGVLKATTELRVLIGGLGMGFTLAAALRWCDETAQRFPNPQIDVAELVPGVIEWNETIIGDCAGRPLEDSRVNVVQGDVYRFIDRARSKYDAILLDVDNGPEGLTHDRNHRLYSADGLSRALNALREGGVLAVWSAGPDPSFAARLEKVGFSVAEHRVRAHAGKGARHVIWLATC